MRQGARVNWHGVCPTRLAPEPLHQIEDGHPPVGSEHHPWGKNGHRLAAGTPGLKVAAGPVAGGVGVVKGGGCMA